VIRTRFGGLWAAGFGSRPFFLVWRRGRERLVFLGGECRIAVMRIIAGSRARRPLVPPKDQRTRPITDRVKESLFGILTPYLEGAKVADLFCGTGSMGLESLSRGAEFALMVERDRDTLLRLKQNIETLDFHRQARVMSSNVFNTGIPTMDPPPEGMEGGVTWDLVFVDPPYKDSRDTKAEGKLGALLRRISGQVPAGCLVVVRHESGVELLPSYERLTVSDRRDYGKMALTFYRQEG